MPPTLEELRAFAKAAMPQQVDTGYGLTRVVEMYEGKLQDANYRVAVLESRVKELEENRKHVLGLVNYIRSSAYSIPTPLSEPDFERTLKDEIKKRDGLSELPSDAVRSDAVDDLI